MLRISPTYRLILIHVFCHLMIIPMCMYGSWEMFLAGFIWYQWIIISAITSGYHRYAAHRTFKASRWYEWYFNILGLFVNAGPVLTWASAHRMHHYFSDTEKDPHSPKHMPAWKVYFGFWGEALSILPRSLKKLSNNTVYMFFYRYYFWLQVACGLVMFAISPYLFLFGFCFPVVLALHGFGLVNWLTHSKDEVQNSALSNILTGGEGWHKNHHENPGNWRIGMNKYQLDPGAWFIQMIKSK